MARYAATLTSAALLGLAWWPLMSAAQTTPAAAVAEAAPTVRDPRGPSADGNNWFEVEVTIFSSVYPTTDSSEVPAPGNTSLRYMGQLRRLQNQSDSWRFPFAGENAVGTGLAASTGPSQANMPVMEAPEFSPADPLAFKILDPERDPYLALDRRSWRFNQLNSRLQSTGDHKVLWHQVWRQPLRPRSQSPALQIEGGSVFGDHYELEGSLRLSGQNDVAALDANLWFSSFTHDRAVLGQGWKLPDRPQPDSADQATSGISADNSTSVAASEPWYPHDIWQLDQGRELGPNALYYLDHPTLGLLIEIRPWLVPEPRVPGPSTAYTNSQPVPAARLSKQ